MSNHSVIEHRANYHYFKMEEDYVEICKFGKQYPQCKAAILAVLEHWINDKRSKGQEEYIYMTYPEWIDAMYGLFRRSTIIACLNELVDEKLITRRPCKRYGKETFEYTLNTKEVQERLKELPERTDKNCRPNLNASKFKRVQKQTDVNLNGSTHPNLNGSEHEDASKSKRIIYSSTQLPSHIDSESTSATSDEDRLTRTEIKTAFTHVLPEVQAEVTLRQAQQGDDAHATTPSRADDRGSVRAGTRPRVPSVDRHAAETEVAGSQGSQTSRATPRAVRPGDAAREEGISNESHPTRDVSDGALVDATPVRRGVEAVAGASAQSVDTSSSLPPNVAGAVGSASPSSGPRRSERKKAEQDAVTQAKSDTKEVQRRINEHRGYALEEKLDLIREREAIKSWCRLHEIGDFDITLQYLKRDPYWGKPENYHRIGGVTLLRETPKALAAQAHRKPASKPKEAEALAPLKVLPPVRERRR